MTVDVDAAKKVIRETRPKVTVFGASAFLFPYDLKGGLADTAHEVGAKVMYDGAHVLGLIAGGKFQDPLREGADWISASTHKTLPGPPGGILLSDLDDSVEANKQLLKKLDSASFPGTLSSHHLHQMAAKAVALTEHIEFGKQYATQIIKNSQAFAQALHERGIKVLCEKRGFTASHQVLVDVKAHGGGKPCAKDLEDAGVISNMNMIPGDEKPMNPSGIRFGTQELTRVGMRENDMSQVAAFVVEVVVKKTPPQKVKADVAEFRKGFPNIHYCYEEGLPAHKFWEFLPKLP
jgi:glycine hydroxymethyltransferase